MAPAAPARFLGAGGGFEAARVVLLGCPFDGTASFRKGARFGPEAIRSASDGLETYSPRLDRDLSDLALCDLGDLAFPSHETEAVLAAIGDCAEGIFRAGKRPLALGGEHLVSLPLVRAALGAFADLVIFQWDAHADLREAYRGECLSHACVMRRVAEMDCAGRMRQFGVRSGTREEFGWMRAHRTMRPLTRRGVESTLKEVGERPVYLTLDVDVLNPGEMPGTGTPEPGGVGFEALSDCVSVLGASGVRLIGADLVELAPGWDATGVSAVAAAKLARELVLVLGA